MPHESLPNLQEQLLAALLPVLDDCWSTFSAEVKQQLLVVSESILKQWADSIRSNDIQPDALKVADQSTTVQFAYMVDHLHQRDLRMAQFQQKLAQDDWDRPAQIEKNQAAINWVRAQMQTDAAPTKE